MNKIYLQKKARESLQKLNKVKKDPRYHKVIGRLIQEKLLWGDHIPPNRSLITVEDVLWVGKFEPQILELLPAILLKRPKLLLAIKPLPDDLIQVIQEIKRGEEKTSFRGVLPTQYKQWIDRIGRKGKYPTLLKTYRFNQNDLELLNELKQKWGEKEISVIRKALKLAKLHS